MRDQSPTASEGERDQAPVWRTAAVLALTSAAVLLLEVSATRLLSFVTLYHLDFMVVSVAILGLGAASVALALSRRLRDASLPALCAVGGAVMALGTILAYAAIVGARFSTARLSTELWGQLGRLGVTYAALVVPFLAGGLVVAACLTRLARRAPLLYGADLLGAALGCVLGVLLAGPLSVPQSFLAAGTLASLAGAVATARRGRLAGIALGAAFVSVVACVTLPELLPPRASPGKGMHFLLEELDPPGQIVATENTPVGQVDVVAASPRVRWSRNPRAPDLPVPGQVHILIDGDADTPVALVGDVGPEELEYLDYLPTSLVFALRRPERVLILGAGGGQDVLAALRSGARHIDAVELNPATVRLVRGPLLEPSGRLYERPGVRLVQAEGRSFVRGAAGQYDVVEMGLVDTWAATSTGGLALSESFLYTVDAFEEYLRALRPGGMVSVARWLRRPPRETLRLTVLAVAALRERGVEDPSRHVAVVGAGSVGTLIVTRDPFDEAQIRRLSELAEERRLDVLYLPGAGADDNAFAELLGASSLEAYVRSYPFDISAVDDDRPFYFDFNRPTRESTLALLLDPERAWTCGSAVVLAVLVQALLLSLLLLGVPALSRRIRIGPSGRGLLGYFCLTGTGFMFLEVSLLQRLTLVVGHPSHAVAVVLGGILAGSGLGALWSGRLLRGRRSAAVVALVLLAGLAGLYALTGTWISEQLLAAAAWARWGLALLVVVPLGVLMGMPTPYGLWHGDRQSPRLTPVLWAATSFASVVGSVLSVAVALRVGFGWSIAAGAGCYLAATLLAPGAAKEPG